MRPVLLALAAALSIILSPARAEARTVTLNVCNYSPEVIHSVVQVVWNCGGDMAEPLVCRSSQGWYRVERGMCRPLTFSMAGYTDFDGRYAYYPEYYVYSKGEQGRNWNNGPSSFCLDHRNAYGWTQTGSLGKLSESSKCLQAGYTWQPGFWKVANGRIEFP